MEADRKPMIIKMFRKYIKVFLWAIAILIIPSFVLWGVGSGLQNRRKAEEAGRIFKRRVNWDTFETALRSVEMFLVLSNRQAYASVLNPVDLAWERLILLHEADRKNIKVSDEEVIQFIQQIAAFQTEDNPPRFDQNRYALLLQRAFRISPRGFEEEIRKTLKISKLHEAIIQHVSLDNEMIRHAYQKRNDQRKVSYVRWTARDFEKDVVLDEASLKDHYKAHQHEYGYPEERKVLLIAAPFDEARSKEEAYQMIDALYDDYLGAKETLPSLQGLAQDRGLDFQETPFFTQQGGPALSGFSESLSALAFTLEMGTLTEPIESDQRILVMQLIEIHPPRTLTFEEAKTRVESSYRRERAKDLAKQQAKTTLEGLQKTLSEGHAWEEAVRLAGLSSTTTDFFTRESYIDAFGFAPAFSATAFSIPLHTLSQVVDIPGGFAVLYAEEEQPYDEEMFSKEKEAFAEELLQQKQEEYFLEWYETLKVKAQLVSHVKPPETASP